MIRVERIQQDIEAIARCTHTPGRGASRPTFSPQWAAAVEYVRKELLAAGCESRFDGAGNLRARLQSLGWDAPAWLCGSHIDTVPNGGDYDGVTGIVVALEMLRSAKDDGIDPLPVELIIFAEEEGPTFGLGMLGSRAMVGELTAAQLGSLRNVEGKNYFQAGAPYGVIEVNLHSGVPNLVGLIEVHIEQGPAMWAEDVRLAVVTAIAGRRQYQAKFSGVPNHAGSTPMHYRADPLVAAARFVDKLDRIARDAGRGTVATVGRIECEPNAINVIPGVVRFTVDVRSPDAQILSDIDVQLKQLVIDCGASESDFVCTEDQPPVQMDQGLCNALQRSAVGGQLATAVSGALHDSAILAPHLPTAMLFIPSKDGISHNRAEFSRFEDIAAAAALVERLVRRPTIAQTSEMTREMFIARFRGIFEHSPWVAERAWASRPFASTERLHGTMCAVVANASRDEQLKLINAHPDLVGRMTLTAESAGEQAAAGLTNLSAAEIKQFQHYNAAYRERFGFPFIICARENKKDAILQAFPRRLKNDRDQEIKTALAEIEKIARLRLNDIVLEI